MKELVSTWRNKTAASDTVETFQRTLHMYGCSEVQERNVEISSSTYKVAAWRSGNVVGRINEVILRRARLVLGWVTVFGG